MSSFNRVVIFSLAFKSITSVSIIGEGKYLITYLLFFRLAWPNCIRNDDYLRKSHLMGNSLLAFTCSCLYEWKYCWTRSHRQTWSWIKITSRNFIRKEISQENLISGLKPSLDALYLAYFECWSTWSLAYCVSQAHVRVLCCALFSAYCSCHMWNNSNVFLHWTLIVQNSRMLLPNCFMLYVSYFSTFMANWKTNGLLYRQS